MNVLELYRRKTGEPKRAGSTHGGEYYGPCPGCGGTDRFRIWPEENQGEGSYWCRQCGNGGDAIQFLRDFEGMTFHQAFERLCRQVPDRHDLAPSRAPMNAASKPDPTTHESPEALWREKALKFCHWAYEQLFENHEAIDYVLGRGIREETLAAFGLGWNSGKGGKDLYRARESWGLSKVLNDKGRRRPLWLPQGLVIPYFIDGKIQRLRIRRPDPFEYGPRYYVVPGSSMFTMVLGPDRRAFVVVESELNAILMAQEARDLVGTMAMGSSSAKPDRRAAEIMVALDFDKAGAKAWTWWNKTFPDSTLAFRLLMTWLEKEKRTAPTVAAWRQWDEKDY